MHPSRGRAGFTLLELVVVLTVIGITLGLAVPSVTGLMYKDEYADAVRRLSATVTEARNRAILDRQEYALVFDFEGRDFWAAPVSYELVEGSEDDWVRVLGDPVFRRTLPGEVSFEEIQVWEELPIDDDQAETTILARGLVEPTRITLTGFGEDEQRLEIKSFGGRIRMVAEYGDNDF